MCKNTIMPVLMHGVFAFALLSSFLGAETMSANRFKLTPTHPVIPENGDVTLNCTDTEASIEAPIEAAIWISSRYSSHIRTIKLRDGDCISEDEYFNNANLFAYNCYTNSITLTLKNISQEQHLERWQCGLKFDYSNNVTLNIFVPPKIRSFRDINVIEGSGINESCLEDPGKANNVSICWTRNNSSCLKGFAETMTIRRVSRGHDGIYTCLVNYTMYSTYQRPVSETITGGFRLTVFFPPEVWAFRNKTMFKGADIYYLCVVNPGKTTNISTCWSKNNNTCLYVSGERLIIRSVSESDIGVYTCFVHYTMNLTYQNPVSETIRGGFSLSIDLATREDHNNTAYLEATVTVRIVLGAFGAIAAVILLSWCYKSKESKTDELDQEHSGDVPSYQMTDESISKRDSKSHSHSSESEDGANPEVERNVLW